MPNFPVMEPDELRAASDANLVVAVGRFRAEALEEIYRRHAGPSFGLAQRILNDRSLAEEIVQEVFLRLWNEPERFERRGRGTSADPGGAHRTAGRVRAGRGRRR